MSRSSWKGVYVDNNAYTYVSKIRSGEKESVLVKVERKSVIIPNFVGMGFAVHNGKTWIETRVTNDMIGHKFGEFVPTRKLPKHPVATVKKQVKATKNMKTGKK